MVGNVLGPSELGVVLQCQGCLDYVLVVEEVTEIHGRTLTTRGTTWWPTPGVDGLDDSVDENVAGAYSEAVRCLGVQAPHAAAAMLRTALAHIVEDKGSEAAKSKKTLYDRIEQMVIDKTLWESFGVWATHIRKTGNAGAHAEKFEPITMGQASELQRFVRQLIEFLYLVPGRLAKAMPPIPKAANTNP
ncbi:hypothetical protein W823_26250 [Williamsia sp. D3]|nr:hypothetical protein W823_26250 [Williamsia sp. D3]